MASRHTSGTVYLGGNRLFISKDFGSTWTRTKDLTRSINRDTLPMMGVLNRDIRLSRNDGDAISEISNIAESPLDPKILWVGTDDGNVQVTTDGGATWTEVSGAITGVKNGTFVGDIVASAASRGTAYVLVRRASRRRLRAVHLPDDRLRQDVDDGHDRTAERRRVGPQPRRVSRQAERAVRRHRARAVRDARQRRALDAAHGQSADDALRRHRRASADEGSGARHARPRRSGFSTTRRRSRSGRRRSRPSARICSTCRARR